LTDRSERKR
jgi:hypothetical protein